MLCGSVDGVFSGLIGGVFVSEEGVLECCGRLQILAEFVVGSCCANFGNAAPTAIQVKNWDRNYRKRKLARPMPMTTDQGVKLSLQATVT